MKVSVIIPAYNHQNFLGESIESVLNQSLSDLELIIINDGSTDNTEKILLNYKDERIKYYHQINSGAHSAINKGISFAKGKYISILNSDDIYEINRLEKCYKFLEANKKYAAIVTKLLPIDVKSNFLEKNTSTHIKAFFDWYISVIPYFLDDSFPLRFYSYNIAITSSNFFYRKSLSKKIGEYLPLRYAHDWDILIRMSDLAEIYYMDEELLRYRIHHKNTIAEKGSEEKIKFEVNWLIAKNIRYSIKLKSKKPCIQDLIAHNHYLETNLFKLLINCNEGLFLSLLAMSVDERNSILNNL
jgi:glycosyltransferase involved in cell wall biosynthesis